MANFLVPEKWKVDSDCLQWQQFKNYFTLAEDDKKIEFHQVRMFQSFPSFFFPSSLLVSNHKSLSFSSLFLGTYKNCNWKRTP